jgi:hypothetical protein
VKWVFEKNAKQQQKQGHELTQQLFWTRQKEAK